MGLLLLVVVAIWWFSWLWRPRGKASAHWAGGIGSSGAHLILSSLLPRLLEQDAEPQTRSWWLRSKPRFLDSNFQSEHGLWGVGEGYPWTTDTVCKVVGVWVRANRLSGVTRTTISFIRFTKAPAIPSEGKRSLARQSNWKGIVLSSGSQSFSWEVQPFNVKFSTHSLKTQLGFQSLFLEKTHHEFNSGLLSSESVLYSWYKASAGTW